VQQQNNGCRRYYYVREQFAIQQQQKSIFFFITSVSVAAAATGDADVGLLLEASEGREWSSRTTHAHAIPHKFKCVRACGVHK
jgi:hypothetical protein